MLEDREIPFNELAKLGETFGFRFSKPTLSDHLRRHLVRSGLVKMRIDRKSKLYLKPRYYSINRELLFQDTTNIDPALSKFKETDTLMNKGSFKEVAWELLRLVYLGDLINTKLFLKGLVSKNPEDRKDVYFSSRIGYIFMDALKYKLVQLSKTAKEDEAKEVLKEFDIQIQRCVKYYETGKLD
jgi:hypothetical protein